jgi:hypothetical protein
MLWFGHFISNKLVFGVWSVWSVAPDIPMALFLSHWPQSWAEIRMWWLYDFLYKIPHSVWILILIQNRKFRAMYSFHLFLDILSHTGQWSIQPFYPFQFKIHGVWDPITWV